MRYADILIDLAAVVKASRGVASKHLELRARQWDRYGQSSSIARPWNAQTQPKKPSRQPGQQPAADAQSPAPAPKPHAEPSLATSSELKQNAGASLTEQFGRYSNAARGSPAHEAEALSRQRTSDPEIPQSPDDVPPGVDLSGLFHTSRASQMLEGKKDSGSIKRPSAPPTKPSWFKDFGHGQHGSKPPAEAEVTKAPAANAATEVAGLKAKTAEGEPAPVKEETTTAGPSPTPEMQPEGSAGPRTKSNQSTVKEHTQMVEEVLAQAGTESSPSGSAPSATPTEQLPTRAHVLRESRVPSSRIGRLWNYGGLAAGMLGGAITEGLSRGFGGGGQGSVLLSSGNMERLVAKLSRMRGAALKLGQMMSFQDSKMLPPQIQEVLQRVQDRADYMPAWQRDKVLKASLGPEWRELFGEFEETPIAAASIGQVHKATLKSTGERVAVKIQFPGVADSINSDLDNLSMILTASAVLPKGLYLNKTIDNARTELGWECDYEREAACGERYRALLASEPDVFVVPKIFGEASGKHVLTMQFMEGVGVTRVQSFTQAQRDWIGTQILRLCLREITEFRFMQTDPNWTNFLYNAATHKLELLDFGASREFPDAFVAQYVALLAAAARSDREAVKALSESLGYLTGHESKTMLDAHIASVLTLAEPFLDSAPEVYDFHDQTITERVKALIPVMIHERLAPPPEETYSLHRKLSGAFLLCAKLGSKVRCRELFQAAVAKMDLEVSK